MPARILLLGLTLALTAATAHAQVVIVDDDFDSYTSTTDLETVWKATTSDGTFDLTGIVSTGQLVPNTGIGLTPPYDDPPGIQGNGVNVFDGINEWNGGGFTQSPPPFELVPTESLSVRYGGDFYDNIDANRRSTIGLRNDTFERDPGVFGTNFLELGFWNADAVDPTDGVTPIPTTGYAYRIALFGANGGANIQNPNWQYFQLDPSLDTDEDELVDQGDIGAGWHRYEAVVTPTTVTVTLDLFRDGVKNLTRDLDGDIEVGVGAPGVDAEVVIPVEMFTSATNTSGGPDPFTSLRIGAPSGVSANLEGVVDNVILETITPSAGQPGDFDGDGDVDVADALRGQRDGETLTVGGDWSTNFGTGSAISAVVAVPEPTSALLLVSAVVGLAACRRR
ncbi:MAG: PEP-CTERM sorting domain-containing protein [Planctomycetota bacterium]